MCLTLGLNKEIYFYLKVHLPSNNQLTAFFFFAYFKVCVCVRVCSFLMSIGA